MGAKFLCATFIVALALFYNNAYSAEVVSSEDSVIFIPQLVRKDGRMNYGVKASKTDNTTKIAEIDANSTTDEQALITAGQLATDNQVNLIKSLKHHAPTVVTDLINLYVNGRVSELEKLHLSRCKDIQNIPADVRKQFTQCGLTHLNSSVAVVNNLINDLADTKQLINTAREKFAQCKKEKEAYIAEKERKDKEKAAAAGGDDSEESTKVRRSIVVRRQKRARTPKTTTTTKKPSKIGKFISGTKKFGGMLKDQWGKHGCYVMAGAEIALNGTVILFDIVTNIYEGYDLVNSMDKQIGKCVTDAFNKFMVAKCGDKFIPVEKDDRKRR